MRYRSNWGTTANHLPKHLSAKELKSNFPRRIFPVRSRSNFFPADSNQEGCSMQIVRAFQISACVAVLCAALVSATRADSWDRKTIVTFSDSVEIPGQVLPAGTYVFKLANSMSDRHIVQVWNENETQLLATMFTVPQYRVDAPDTPLFEFDEPLGTSPMALRTWFYPGNNIGQEFVYRYSGQNHSIK
jgi:hypothetical protein